MKTMDVSNPKNLERETSPLNLHQMPIANYSIRIETPSIQPPKRAFQNRAK
jgi:hypothetical protein